MTPLAEILRPKSLDEYIGQQHLIGPGAVLRTLIESGNIPSMIFWGPPGIGKTTLAMIISQTLKRPFHTLSAISSGVKEVREVINAAQEEEGAILFIDEIHRFNKAQQDSLLGAVERGTITLIGATTENPSFEVISALLSRCQVYVLKEFGEEEMRQLIASAVKHYANEGLDIEVKEADALMRISGGDARKLLNAVELVVNKGVKGSEGGVRRSEWGVNGGVNGGVRGSERTNAKIIIDNKTVTEVIQQNLAFYDKGGEMHYDIISAFIKSMRGSDPNGAVYWLARMIAGGEDPLFIARRMLIFASVAVRVLPGLLGQEQCDVYGPGQCGGGGEAVGRPAGAAAHKECADEADEEHGLRRRLQVRPRLRGQLHPAGVPARRPGGKPLLRTRQHAARERDTPQPPRALGHKVRVLRLSD